MKYLLQIILVFFNYLLFANSTDKLNCCDIEESLETFTIEVTCPENQEIVGNDDNTVTLTWPLPEVISTCPDGFEIVQISGPQQGLDTLIGFYFAEYEIFDNCNPDEKSTCKIEIFALSSRVPDPFMQFPFENELTSIVEIIDFDNDGLKDIIGIVGDQGTFLYTNEGNNIWNSTILTTEDNVMNALDLDADGDIDLIYEYPYAETPLEFNEGLGILENNGAGDFIAHELFDEARALDEEIYRESDLTVNELEDFDNDGLLDIAFTVVYGRSISCSGCTRNFQFILFNNGGFNYEQVNIGSTFEPEYVDSFSDSGDLDGDGFIDLLRGFVNPEYRIGISYRLNASNRDFSGRGFPDSDKVDRVSRPMIFDFDNDGDLDVHGVRIDGNRHFYENNGLGNFSATLVPGNILIPGKPTIDYNGDGDLDVISILSESWSEYLDFFNYYSHPISFDLTSEDHKILNATDMDDDGDIDLFVYHITDDRVVYWENKRIDDEEVEVTLEVICPEDVFVTTESSSAFVDLVLPTVVSTCDGDITIDTSGALFPNQIYPTGQHTVVYTITDDCNSEPVQCSVNITVQQISGGAGECPNELTGFNFIGELDDHKYFLSEEKLNWGDASVAAVKVGTYLVSIDDKLENDFIFTRQNEIAFIGYSDANSEGNFTWQTGQSANYENLGLQNSENGDFANINFWNGQWGLDDRFTERKYIVELDCANTFDCSLNFTNADVNCFDNRTNDTADDGFFINVQIDAFGLRTSQWTVTINGADYTGNYQEASKLGPFNLAAFGDKLLLSFEDAQFDCSSTLTLDLPESCTGSDLCPEELEGFAKFGTFGNSTYYMSNTKENWQTANSICETNNGHLASISSPEENDFITSIIYEILFIGISDRIDENVFAWGDGTDVSFTKFSDCGFCSTNSDLNDYVSMNFWDGSWNVDGPVVERKFLLELTCNPEQTDTQIMPRMKKPADNIPGIQIYPNPTNGITHIVYESEQAKDQTLNLYDAKGIQILNIKNEIQKGVNRLDIDMTSYPAGLYILRIGDEHKKIFKN